MTADQKFKIHIGLLIFSLIIVLAVLFNLKRLIKTSITEGYYPNAIIRGNEFYHPWLGFSIEAADKTWEIEQRTDQASFGEDDSTNSIFSNAQPVVELRHQLDSSQYTLVEVAALRLRSLPTALALARRLRNDFLKRQRGNNLQFLQDVVATQEGRYEAAYFIVQSQHDERTDVWIITAVVRDSLGYIISARVTNPGYEAERLAIEKIVAGFKLHPLQKRPDDIRQTGEEYKF